MSDGNITSSVNLDVHGDANIRFGELPKKTVRDSIGIDTDITSPYSYFKRRNELYEDVKDDQRIDALEHEHLLYWNRYQMCVSINIFNGTIVFHENILTTVNGASISGRIIMDKNLAALKINTETTYTALDLSKLLKMNRLLFSSAEANMKLVADLRAFKAKIETEIDAAIIDYRFHIGNSFIDQPYNVECLLLQYATDFCKQSFFTGSLYSKISEQMFEVNEFAV